MSSDCNIAFWLKPLVGASALHTIKSNENSSQALQAKVKLLLMSRLWFVSPNAMLSKAKEKLQNLSVLVFWHPAEELEELPSDMTVDIG